MALALYSNVTANLVLNWRALQIPSKNTDLSQALRSISKRDSQLNLEKWELYYTFQHPPIHSALTLSIHSKRLAIFLSMETLKQVSVNSSSLRSLRNSKVSNLIPKESVFARNWQREWPKFIEINLCANNNSSKSEPLLLKSCKTKKIWISRIMSFISGSSTQKHGLWANVSKSPSIKILLWMISLTW
jgi:sulfur transfer complex TusBCD TusB component (DsrH family)